MSTKSLASKKSSEPQKAVKKPKSKKKSVVDMYKSKKRGSSKGKSKTASRPPKMPKAQPPKPARARGRTRHQQSKDPNGCPGCASEGKDIPFGVHQDSLCIKCFKCVADWICLVCDKYYDDDYPMEWCPACEETRPSYAKDPEYNWELCKEHGWQPRTPQDHWDLESASERTKEHLEKCKGYKAEDLYSTATAKAAKPPVPKRDEPKTPDQKPKSVPEEPPMSPLKPIIASEFFLKPIIDQYAKGPCRFCEAADVQLYQNPVCCEKCEHWFGCPICAKCVRDQNSHILCYDCRPKPSETSKTNVGRWRPGLVQLRVTGSCKICATVEQDLSENPGTCSECAVGFHYYLCAACTKDQKKLELPLCSNCRHETTERLMKVKKTPQEWERFLKPSEKPSLERKEPKTPQRETKQHCPGCAGEPMKNQLKDHCCVTCRAKYKADFCTKCHRHSKLQGGVCFPCREHERYTDDTDDEEEEVPMTPNAYDTDEDEMQDEPGSPDFGTKKKKQEWPEPPYSPGPTPDVPDHGYEYKVMSKEEWEEQIKMPNAPKKKPQPPTDRPQSALTVPPRDLTDAMHDAALQEFKLSVDAHVEAVAKHQLALDKMKKAMEAAKTAQDEFNAMSEQCSVLFAKAEGAQKRLKRKSGEMEGAPPSSPVQLVPKSGVSPNKRAKTA